jgi:hypothetical protein
MNSISLTLDRALQASLNTALTLEGSSTQNCSIFCVSFSYLPVYVCMCMCMCYMLVYMCICVYVYMCVCVYVYVYMCICECSVPIRLVYLWK